MSHTSSHSNSSGSEEWVEKKPASQSMRDDWMSMGGNLKTFTKDDIKPKREDKDKRNIDSYNPATSSRKLNPYWKDGGTGVLQTPDQYRKTNKFMKPNDDNYYSKSSSYTNDSKRRRSSQESKDKYSKSKSYNWRRNEDDSIKRETSEHYQNDNKIEVLKEEAVESKSLYLSDEKMNKLAAKIVKAEILGDTSTVKELKAKLEAAKEFRKQNPDSEKHKDNREALLLISTTASGSSRPVVDYNEKNNKKGKIKTHNASGRVNYFPNDDKYDISRMDMRSKSKRDTKKKKRRHRSSSHSNSSGSEEWVEKKPASQSMRDDWMSMGGNLKTFTKDDIKPKREDKDKRNIDSYNPATSSRKLNPYWKDGGTGVPQTPDQYRKTNKFMKPNDDNYYSKSSSYTNDSKRRRSSQESKDKYSKSKSYNWRRNEDDSIKRETSEHYQNDNKIEVLKEEAVESKSLYLSDEKMNKLAAKIVKAEILGDTSTVKELKAKLEAAKEFRKQNPDSEKHKDNREALLLISTTASGSSRPVVDYNEKNNKKGKIKTHNASGRVNYFPNDDKYDISRMFEEEKYGSNHRNDMQLAVAASKCKASDNLEDFFEEGISKNKQAEKERKLEENYAIRQNQRLERSQENCMYCFESKNMLKHLMISCGNNVYLSLPSKKSLVEGHCIITTIHHYPCVTAVDEDMWEEITNYRNMVTQFFNKQNKDVVFFETAIKLFRQPHMAINCVPLPRDVGDMASIYFKKALLECETEWSMNKKVIELKGKNIRKGVPKGLPYFWVDFGMDPGFAHVVEDQRDFPETFAQQIIGGMLDLDHRLWKKPQAEFGEVQRKKVLDFLKEWKPFENLFKSDTKR